jgi:hypothetical protein
VEEPEKNLITLSDLSMVPGHRNTKRRVKAAAAIREVIFTRG